jgi:hypothetical protein
VLQDREIPIPDRVSVGSSDQARDHLLAEGGDRAVQEVDVVDDLTAHHRVVGAEVTIPNGPPS